MNTRPFKNSEVGPIPKDWEVKRLGKIWTSFKTGPFGSSLHARDYVRNGIPIINPMHLLNGIILPSVDMSVDDGTAHRLSAYQLGENDVVIGRRGEIGRVALVTSHESGWLCGTGCFFVHFKPTIHAPYVALYLRTPRCVERLVGEAVGTTLINLNQSILAKTLVALPPLSEQRRISAALSEADDWIASLDKLIEKKKLVKQGAMQALLSGKTRLPGFSGEWEERRLGEIGVFPTNTVPTDSVKLSEYIGTDNMLPDRAGVEKYEDVLPYKNVREYRMGDVLISNIRPYLKKIWLADRNGGCSTDVIVIRIRDKDVLIPEFLFSKLADASFFDFVMNNAIGTKMPRGDKRMMEMFRIPVPTLAEQRAIASVLSDMDAELAALSREKAKAEQIKQGMMQELLTGRVRLAEGE